MRLNKIVWFGFLLAVIGAAAGQNTPNCNGSVCAVVIESPISLYGGDAAGLAFWGRTLFIAENVNNLGIAPQGPLVLEVGETGKSAVITPPGLLGDVTALAVDSAGNLYIADGNGVGVGQPPCRNVVWKLNRHNGTIAVFAAVHNPTGLALDSRGNLYVSSFADGAVYEFSPTGIPIRAPLRDLASNNLPYGLAVDSSDNLYVAVGWGGNGTTSAIYKVTPSNGVSVFLDYADAPFYSPASLVFDRSGNLYASYYNGLKILRIAPDGSYTVFPGGGVGDDAANGLAIHDQDLFVAVNGGRTTAYPAVVALRGLIPPAP